ncbi:adenine phosphoribosyltransferase [Candidatus Desantisbacteria bacterium CG_4_10_14_0_8_um_filter_48_22]|uniref:Adenine phosphoribosyltransferase n=1 Tax=Candidatus Desantisbacteria bacterium CG_4_10_14_0_8_um_filter_48_22 TaxID=1974543 RepID=A0A2M7SF35_9BACT|nr:MAG: adenine phosphoribosyltransferase [Candidatus Desantisbacteria bacterium CG1_02_49_89]PIV56689.1 MAG: adenine phosphoribosyltransferase [Candidatus Desantisbacteria bacterium CG02_land_8_20_14_3_00_49_13]PIZ18147.1 MAG: adenine phosphoribosyltransferase [Candidatus Desantisbacteria bacterium CG_4_10_14_0_8_um_filter_48_22]PJB27197.1 MAG: adenine phosphoribosyltransferase [Candidatus Desantisbacteria bacterium CG_4_9_14_3_um_filter_50_7]
MEDLKKYIRTIPNFPKKGIMFRDITTLVKNGKALKKVVDAIAAKYKRQKIDVVVGAESRGFIVGAGVAYKLGVGLALVRKKGKLPFKTISATYELEYGTDTVEMHKDAIKKGQRVLIVDDLLATGGTASAAVDLVRKLGGRIVGIAFIIELVDLNGRNKLKGYDIFSLVEYKGE